MQHPPPEATSKQTFVEDLDRQVADAQSVGGYTAVLKLAEERLRELRSEFDTLTAGHKLTRMTNQQREEPRRTWTPEKARLNEQISELESQIRQWDQVVVYAEPFVGSEALGWTILPDGTSAKVLDNGKVLSVAGFTESDGTVWTVNGRDERWERRHQRHVRAFGDRVRAARIALAAATPLLISTARRSRERRPRATRRTASSSTSSSADPGDPDSEPPRRRGDLRHVSYPLTAFLRTIGGTR